MNNIRNRSDRWFDAVNNALIVVIGLICLLPFLHVLAKSLSNQASVMGNKVTFYPIGMHLEAFRFVFAHTRFSKRCR